MAVDFRAPGHRCAFQHIGHVVFDVRKLLFFQHAPEDVEAAARVRIENRCVEMACLVEANGPAISE